MNMMTIQNMNHNIFEELDIAVIIPCYNEALSIKQVIEDFKASLPNATIFVYDNNSSDETAKIAHEAGAVVRKETRQGKGFVVRRMFADIEADIYVMVDGDNTYDASRAPDLVNRLVRDGLDMVNGAREETVQGEGYRPGHKFGNIMISSTVRWIFGNGFQDMLSGYRVFSRRFVRSFPTTSTGFEIETELTVHALDLNMPIAEEKIGFKDRDDGSESKLRTFSDGFRILWTIITLLKRERPITLFGLAAFFLMSLAMILATPIFFTYFETGLVPRFPTLIVATGLGVISLLSLTCGLILDTVTAGRKELKRLHYLNFNGVYAQKMLKNILR